jgi:hypothetical protein
MNVVLINRLPSVISFRAFHFCNKQVKCTPVLYEIQQKVPKGGNSVKFALYVSLLLPISLLMLSCARVGGGRIPGHHHKNYRHSCWKVRKLILLDVSYWKPDTTWIGGLILTSTIKLYSTLTINMSKK